WQTMCPLPHSNESIAAARGSVQNYLTTRSMLVMPVMTKEPACCRCTASSCGGQLLQSFVLPAREALDVADVGCRQFRARLAHGGRSNGAALHKEMFAYRESDSGLLFITRQGQVGVEDVVRAFGVAG